MPKAETAAAALPRGIRNNNPGNIRGDRKSKWQGLAEPPNERGFCRFTEPKWGIRAIARTLITYQDQHHLRTVSRIIGRWAPAAENDTEGYVSAVLARTGRFRDDKLDMHNHADLRPLVEAIIWQENGQQPYTPAQLDAGLILAGVEPPKRSLAKSRTVRGGQVAAGAGSISLVTGLVSQLQEALPLLTWLRENAPMVLSVIGLVTLLGVGWVLWARWDDHRKGLR